MNPVYRDSGEGGLFAYAVWPSPEAECFVDVEPNFFVGDCLVSALGPLEEVFESQGRCFNSLPLGSYEENTISTAISVGTAVFLGSTSGSFLDDHRGEYFSCSAADLTDAGRRIIEQLEAVYGQATYLTYLDT